MTGPARPFRAGAALFMLGLLLPAVTARAEVVLSSPGGRVQVTVGVNARHEWVCRMQRDGVAVLEESPLGVIVDGANLGSAVLGVIGTAPATRAESYPVRGGHATASVRYNEIYVSAAREAATDTLVSLVLRAYDDGLAYRYLIPGAGGRTIGGEASGWTFPPGSKLVFQTDTADYEGQYYRWRLGEIDDAIGGPFTVELPDGGGYATVSEGALSDSSGMTFRAAPLSRTIASQFLDDTTWTLPGGALTPWRLVIASATLDGLVNSDMASSVNPPPDPAFFPEGAATAWIRPGRAVWSWFTDWDSPASLEIQVRHVEYAHQLGFEYCLVDKGWEEGFNGGGDPYPALASLVQYAHSGGRQVDIWVWKEWSALRDDGAREAFFSAVAGAGCVGVKVDNLAPEDGESQRNVRFQVQILRDAARHRLMVNFHGCNKDTGLSRTWPNELTREGLMGLERNLLWFAGYTMPPEHNTFLPFTRFVTGPGDYTPLCLDARKIGQTTLAHQVASAGIFVSPMLVLADDPANLLGHGEALDVIKALPPVWDETRVLPQSAIGRLALYARRSGERWFLFALSGDSSSTQALRLDDLPFLGARRYAAVFLSDATSRTLAREEAYGFGRHTGLEAPLLPGGGFAAMFTPTDWTDLDGDLIPDAADCAPLSATLSMPVTYYLDRDGDQCGDAATTMALPLTAPFPGLVPWGNDPDDSKASLTAAPLAKGSRRLGLDFGDSAEDNAWRPDLARQLGAEVIPLSMAWGYLEPMPGTYDAAASHTLALARQLYGAQEFQVSLTLSPIEGAALAAPADIQAGLADGSIRWSDPAVIDRYKRLLDFVKGRLAALPVLSLQVGRDLDGYLPLAGPGFINDYGVFFRAVAAHARGLWPGVKVGMTATLKGLLNEPARGPLLALNRDADAVSVSYLPSLSNHMAPPPTAIWGQIRQLLDLYPDQTLYFQSVGYPSSPAVGSSQIQQSQFLAAFFDAWDRNAGRIPYACFTRLNDLAESAAARQAAPLAGRSHAARVSLGEAIRSCGLRTFDGSGSAKSGYHTLRTLAFERDWWRVPPPVARAFRMGFTPLAYDQALESDPTPGVLDWTYQKIGQQADVAALYFDNGVPWVEAYQDNLDSPVLPYSNHLKNLWQAHLNRLPPRARRLVALNALGVPRDQIAAYWGVGQGYYHDAQFKRVGTGRIADYENRLPPTPWDGQAFNSPMVKKAYLAWCRRVLDTFQPEYLITGTEANLLVQSDPARFRQFVELQQHLYTSLKAIPRYSRTKIVVSLTSEFFLNDEFGVPCQIDNIQDPGLMDRQWQGVRELLPWVDMVGLSIYPIKTKYAANSLPAYFFEQLFGKFAAITSKPVLVSECGYPAVPFSVAGQPFKGDPAKQERFLRLLFDEVQRAGNVRLLVNFSVRDSTAAMDQLRQGATATPPYINADLASFFQYFEFIGIYDAQGGTRPATQLWQRTFGLPYTGPDAARSRAAEWERYR